MSDEPRKRVAGYTRREFAAVACIGHATSFPASQGEERTGSRVGTIGDAISSTPTREAPARERAKQGFINKLTDAM
jgi:hypothetical protein